MGDAQPGAGPGSPALAGGGLAVDVGTYARVSEAMRAAARACFIVIAVQQLRARNGESLNALVTRIDAERTGNLSSALRVFVLEMLSPRA